ncbi:ADH1_2 [Sanghuangporus sanghuang]
MPSQPTIPAVQRAFVLSAPGEDLTLITDYPVVQPSELKPGQCLVKLTHSGVCHTDLSIRSNIHPVQPKANLIGGHEGIGIVVAVAENTEYGGVKVGDRVGIKFVANSCLNCEMCLKGLEGLCYNLQSSGAVIDGTFCEYAVSYVNHVTPIPDSLDSPTASAIMCAGLSVYSALQQCNAHIGDWVIVPGAGGGLGHLAIQYAVAMGLRVVAIDTGSEKRELCISLGAEKWIDYKTSSDVATDVRAATGGLGAHAAIVTAGGNDAYASAGMYLRSGGYLMCVGIPQNGLLSLPILLVAGRGLTVRGIFVGNRQQSIEAVNIAAAGKVKCRYSIRGLSELESVYEEMEKGRIVGRVVLDISK